MALVLATLSGCGCKPDPGDKVTSVSGYVSTCWAVAKREEPQSTNSTPPQ